MKDTINELKNSPLFNLSLASKELFHSNFLAWFFEQNPKTTSVFFSKKTESFLGELQCVKRENRNLDLVLYFENENITIENKIKSIPDESQLKRYKAKANNLFVLSIYEPQNFEDYNFIHYGDIAELFQERSKSEESNYLSGLYNDYSELINSLLSLTEEWQRMEKFDFHSRYNAMNGQNNYQNLREIRIHDLYHKVKYNQLKQLLFGETSQRISKEFQEKLKPFEWFSNGTGAASLWYFLREKNEVKFELQIQDNMLRLMIISKNCADKKEVISKNKTIQKMYGLFSEKYVKEITEDNLYPLKGGFNQYGKDLIYRYKRINHQDIEKIVEASSQFFAEAIQIAEGNKNELLNLFDN